MKFTLFVLWLAGLFSATDAADLRARGPLDPKGQVHIPIGVANTVDSLKTFVEAEGSFSPGFGTYGVYFWVWDEAGQRLVAPTMDGVECTHGLGAGGALIPWSSWRAGGVEVKTEVCEVQRVVETNKICVVAARVHLTNRGENASNVSLYVAVRPLGPAGGDIRSMGFSEVNDTLALNGYPAVVAMERAQSVGAVTDDTIGDWALKGELPPQRYPNSTNGLCSGAMRFDIKLAPGQKKTFGFTCPVLPGRRAAGHRWDGVSPWAQLDLNRPNSTNSGVLQKYAGLRFYRQFKADMVFDEAAVYWKGLVGRATMKLPDPRWGESFAAMTGHAVMCLNEGAPDVAVVNYNVFNRDGMYLANIYQKAGQFDLADLAIHYFLDHPFNGRVQPEADNPGQILWIMGEHWKFTRDRKWLESVYPAARQIAAMIRYYRTTPGPHWVWDTSLNFGDSLPPDRRKELKPGACDGHNPAYTEAYDIAGLRAAVVVAEALGMAEDAGAWKQLANSLFEIYEQKFGAQLPQGYGSYSVLWPCRLYPFNEGKGFEQFKGVGAQQPSGWRYFPLARSHQGFLAGNRPAAFETLNRHLDHPQMKGWYAFDEGGNSGVGGWNHARTTWRQGEASDAMPHGWVIAEFQLLLRDALLFEDGDKLVLLAGVPLEWFTQSEGMKIENMPTHFGVCSLDYSVSGTGATLTISGAVAPAKGFVLRLPPGWAARAMRDGKPSNREPNGDLQIPAGTSRVELAW